ncbi:MerR family transcriptional regulator [Niallia circulans]|uniref:MerR family transcriptional regulator n=1 Tax=Niallia TaxID=2837506 RepID=UPI00077CB27A|nr:MerR family transcriptional regulator [Niallia circulans]MDR4318875.1 MerR family transcriptional regulator [Niallia circulans]MED3838212.1 MerR family transcriptional regulator [Niallia circulans]MED4242247.1 MerR family transcriptional regulator [Niallia circulans]MED4248558.1 MerR family transcriptional regulator [Niallia circulans]PAD23433.1 MerR family transcriptional regulator [Niallia circulans]
MKETYSVGKFSELTGIPVRTLHYYEEMGLIKPHRQASGHRIYKLEDMVELQKILSLKSLGFSLNQIGELLKVPQYDQSLVEMLSLQQQALELKLVKMEESLELIGRLIAIIQAEKQLDHPLMFSLIHNMNQESLQREWVENHLSDYTVQTLFERSAEAQTKMDAKTVQFSRAVRRLSEGPIDSEEAEAVICAYVNWALANFDQKAMDNLRNLDEEHYAKLEHLVEMPFNEKESAWLDKAMEHYFSKYMMSEQGELKL